MDDHGKEQAVRSAQPWRTSQLALEQAELLPEQGDLQVLGPFGAMTHGEQVEHEREELRGE
jgi:hypothetical protein